MPLTKDDMAARNERVMYIDTKQIDMDRALINLFAVLRHGGSYPAPRTGRRMVTARELARWLCEDTTNFPGFTGQESLAQAWLEADFLNLVNRGGPREQLAAPRPIHLNAYKLRNPQHCKDYGATPQLYRLLADEGSNLPDLLRQRLMKGCDPHTGKYWNADVDVETLTILRLADHEGPDAPGRDRLASYAPLCTGQGRLFRDDVYRLLVYEAAIPRPVWVEYFKTLCGLHLAMFVRRLAAQVGDWMRDRAMTTACLDCPVQPTVDHPLADCPFPLEFIVDMGDRQGTPMATLSQASADEHFRAIDEFVRDLVGLTKLVQFIEMAGRPPQDARELVQRALQVYATDDSELRAHCRFRLNAIIGSPPKENLARIRDELQDDPFRAYVECILAERFGGQRSAFRKMYRSLLGANKDSGMLVTGRSPRSPIRFRLGTRLLETLVQIAVLRSDGLDAAGQPMFRSEPILVRDLQAWLRRRYGIAIGPSNVWQRFPLAPADLKALRENEERFKERLREIGFYTDLSDASNAQRVIPRYLVGE